ncbi:MAG: hypothetical protein IT210_12930 [Armatimonadetes bacterium]|nr:hypothetical protein [Armatimonadota bacterium]
MAVRQNRSRPRREKLPFREIVARMRQGDAFNFFLSVFLILFGPLLMTTRERLLGFAWVIAGIAIWAVRYVIALEPVEEPAPAPEREAPRSKRRS